MIVKIKNILKLLSLYYSLIQDQLQDFIEDIRTYFAFSDELLYVMH